METREMEPAPTIRAELARRRMTVGRLSSATGIPLTTLQRRLARPADFRLPELAVIATELGISLETLTTAYSTEVTS